MDSPGGRSRSVSGSGSTLAPQQSLNSVSAKLGGRTPVRIYFLDNSSKMFLVEASLTVLDLIKMIMQKFDIGNVDILSHYFGLFESLNGASIDSALELQEKVNDVISRWEDGSSSKLVFMIRLFMPSIWGIQYKDVVAARLGKPKESLTIQSHLESAEVIDTQLLHLQYNQAVYSVITGLYPTSPDLALELGSYHFIYKFGAYDDSKHQVGFLANRIVEFLPYSHLRGSDLDEWESKLIKGVADMHTGSTLNHSFDPQRRYVETVMLRLSSLYGSTFFRCSQTQFTSLPPDLYIAVHRQGVNLVEKGKSRQVLRQFHIEELNRWGYKPGSLFYFEVRLDGKDITAVEFGTREGQTISDLLTDYAHAYIQEIEMEEARGLTSGISETASDSPSANGLPPPPSPPPPPPARKPLASSGPPPPPARPPPKSCPASPRPRPGPSQYSSHHHRCATVIQSNYRGYALRSEWVKEDAAITIQAYYRGYRGRCHVSEILEELFRMGELDLGENEGGYYN